ncbi:fatty acid elongase 2 [Pseudohyphozyma bogoriensis]|nr:fatty acid elongase 2 [Pseudohyphozyma bogoriensis]
MGFTPVYSTLSALPFPNIPSYYLQEWQPGKTPLSTTPQVAAALAAYLAIIFTGQHLMKDRKAMKLKGLFMVHNALLSIGSGLVLACMLEELIPLLARDGFLASICSPKSWTPKLEQMYLLNYYFKYWELADTMFLVVKKKPLKFLHVFHHSNTALLCYVQLNGTTSVSWVPIVLNLTVHVLMYYYYGMSTAGYKIWWKKYLTTMQITQFVIDLAVVYFASYTLFSSRYAPSLPHCGSCAGTEGAAFFGCALLTSYLYLFIDFYRKTYKKQPIALPVDEKPPVLHTSSSDDKLMENMS